MIMFVYTHIYVCTCIHQRTQNTTLPVGRLRGCLIRLLKKLGGVSGGYCMGYSDTTKNKLHNPSVLHETNFLSPINPSLAHVYCSKHCVNSNRREGEAIRIGREESELGKRSRAPGRSTEESRFLEKKVHTMFIPPLHSSLRYMYAAPAD